MTASEKFGKVVQTYLQTGKVEVSFDELTLLTTLNGEDFSPNESKELVEKYRGNPVFSNIMQLVNDSGVAKEAKDFIQKVQQFSEELLNGDEDDYPCQEGSDLDLDSDESGEDITLESIRKIYVDGVVDTFVALRSGEVTEEDFANAVDEYFEFFGGEDLVVEIEGIGKLVVLGDSIEDDEDDDVNGDGDFTTLFDYAISQLEHVLKEGKLATFAQDTKVIEELIKTMPTSLRSHLVSQISTGIAGAIVASVAITAGEDYTELLNDLPEFEDVISAIVSNAYQGALKGEDLPDLTELVSIVTKELKN